MVDVDSVDPANPVGSVDSVEVDSVEPVDWAGLRAAARRALDKAYVPYSHYPVGAAALADDGRLLTGANIENAAFGVTLCAECSLVSALVMSGGGRFAAFTCVNALGETIMPCGRCRQILWEHGGPELLVDTPQGVVTMTEVLPQAFGPGDLDHVREATR